MADVGTGTTIVFGTSSFSASILDVDVLSAVRESIATSHMGTTTAHTFMPADLMDWGECSFEILYDPDTQPPIQGVAETVTITAPIPTGLSNGATAAGSAFCTGFSAGYPLEDRMTGQITLKWSGDLTFGDAS